MGSMFSAPTDFAIPFGSDSFLSILINHWPLVLAGGEASSVDAVAFTTGNSITTVKFNRLGLIRHIRIGANIPVLL